MRERGVGRRPCCCSIVLHFRNFRGWLRRLPLRIGRCYVVGRLSPVVTSSQPASIADLPDRTAHCPHLFTPPVQKQNKTKRKRNETAPERPRKDFLSALVRDSASQPLRPPLPDIVRRVLSRCRFAYLSTVDVDSRSSHLSLMRFTYLPEEETIIMSTNRRTKKYDMLERQGGVALLVHDFSEAVPLPPPSSSSSSSGGSGGVVAGGGGVVSLTGEYSITLNGTCSVVEDGETL